MTVSWPSIALSPCAAQSDDTGTIWHALHRTGLTVCEQPPRLLIAGNPDDILARLARIGVEIRVMADEVGHDAGLQRSGSGRMVFDDIISIEYQFAADSREPDGDYFALTRPQ